MTKKELEKQVKELEAKAAMSTRFLKDINLTRNSLINGGFGNFNANLGPNQVLVDDGVGNLTGAPELTFNPASTVTSAAKLFAIALATLSAQIVGSSTISGAINVVQVAALNSINNVSPLTVTIDDTDFLGGQWITIKDVTGICSRGQPIKIVAQSGALIDNVAQKFITAPYGSLNLQWNGAAFFSMPWNPSQVGSQWVTGALDLDTQIALIDPIIVRLPRGPNTTGDITLFFDAVNMLPYMTITPGGAAASFTFNHTLNNTVDDILIRKTGSPLTLNEGTNFYFTSDGLINTTTQTYQSFGSFGQLRLWIHGITVNNDMPPQEVIINFDSRGKIAAFADISIPYSFRSTQHF